MSARPAITAVAPAVAEACLVFGQRHKGLDVWREEFTSPRTPKAYDLRSGPFERTDESRLQLEVNKLFYVVPAQAVVARWLGTFKELPPRRKPACFNIGAVMEKLTAPQGPGK